MHVTSSLNVILRIKLYFIMSDTFHDRYSTVDGTAIDKADYKPVNNRSVTFKPGQVYTTVDVEIVDDDYNEEDKEYFDVVIGSRVPTTLTVSHCFNVTIEDDDLGKINQKGASVPHTTYITQYMQRSFAHCHFC